VFYCINFVPRSIILTHLLLSTAYRPARLRRLHSLRAHAFKAFPAVDVLRASLLDAFGINLVCEELTNPLIHLLLTVTVTSTSEPEGHLGRTHCLCALHHFEALLKLHLCLIGMLGRCILARVVNGRFTLPALQRSVHLPSRLTSLQRS
jgi:hypothetical protein